MKKELIKLWREFESEFWKQQGEFSEASRTEITSEPDMEGFIYWLETGNILL